MSTENDTTRPLPVKRFSKRYVHPNGFDIERDGNRWFVIAHKGVARVGKDETKRVLMEALLEGLRQERPGHTIEMIWHKDGFRTLRDARAYCDEHPARGL
jgi:hypothetical protein